MMISIRPLEPHRNIDRSEVANYVVANDTQQIPVSQGSVVPTPVPTRPASNFRRDAVIEMFQHAWRGYKKHAWGCDELAPETRHCSNWGANGFGLSIVESMDLIYIMGLKEEWNDAIRWVESSFVLHQNADLSLFETTIRLLGGFISAYQLSGEKILLTRAKEVGDMLLHAFRSGHLPHATVNAASGAASTPNWIMSGCTSTSEVTTLQLEFQSLTDVTGDPKYAAAAMEFMPAIVKLGNSLPDGLLGQYICHGGTSTHGILTMGSRSDSYYEYLLKMWLLSGRTSTTLQSAYSHAAAGIIDQLFGVAPRSKHTYIGERERGGGLIGKMDHLACYASGMYALGVWSQVDVPNAAKHQDAAARVASTCRDSYKMNPTGLGPEIMRFGDSLMVDQGSKHYILRPETIESYMYLWRLTHDEKYRDWGWEMLQAINTSCRLPAGFSGVRDVTVRPPTFTDKMESFFLAETLKYMFLLFSDDSVLPLDQWVFNTEAHPLQIMREREGTASQVLRKIMGIFIPDRPLI